MNFGFCTAHINTLVELKQLADAHNYRLNFGVTSYPIQTDDIDIDYLVRHFSCPKDIAEEICDKCDFELSVGGESYAIYFELNKDSEHNMLKSYGSNFGFKVHINKYVLDGELREKSLNWLRENSKNGEWGLDEDNDFLLFDQYENEEVYGFNGVQKEGCCYRTGIILAVFAQLVCDYLGEERIKRTY